MIKKKSVVIFGANGFLGRHLSVFLKKLDYEVVRVSKNGDVDVNLDITDSSQFNKLNKNPEIVINCASALPSGDFWNEKSSRHIFEVNLWGSYNIAKWIMTTVSIEQVINLSTLMVVDKPWPILLNEKEKTYPFSSHQAYSISKLNQELIFNTLSLNNQIKVCNARLSALFGENMKWGGVLCDFIDKAISNKDINITNGSKVSADFLYVENACLMIEKLITNEFSGIINLACGEELFLKHLATKIYSVAGKNIDKIINTDMIDAIDNRCVIDVEEIKKYIKKEDVLSFEEGLKRTIQYRREQAYLQ